LELVIASNNQHKVREIRQILSPWFSNVITMKDAGLTLDVVEDGQTFEENSLKKAKEVFDALCGRYAVLADDSGLSVDALNGAPGVLSARFAVEHDDAANNEKLLYEMRNVPDDERSARFVCVVTLIQPGKEPLVLRGECEGMIARSLSGQNGFGYDPLFYVPALGKTFSELSDEEKNAVSHRGNALALLRSALESESKWQA
jgi:XTP/dITP diphosphohydrolase